MPARKPRAHIHRIKSADMLAALMAARYARVQRAGSAPIKSAPAKPVGPLSDATRAEVDRILAARRADPRAR